MTKALKNQLNEMTKSDAIRHLNATNPDWTSGQIGDAMREAGIEVTNAHCSSVLVHDKAKGGKPKTAGKKTTSKKNKSMIVETKTEVMVDGSSLMVTAEFARQVGGIDKAKEMLEELMKVQL